MLIEILKIESKAKTTDEIIEAINKESDILTGNGVTKEEVEAEIKSEYIVADGKYITMYVQE